MSRKKYTRYSRELKLEAIRLADESGKPKAQVARELGIRVNQIVQRSDDLALAMRARSIRMEAPIPGKAAVGIEIPNPTPRMVRLREVLELTGNQPRNPLAVVLGKDVVVTGAGTIGLLAIQIFKAMGCREIVASDISAGKLEMAKAMRASMSIPAALPPVKHDGKLLVDGGIGNNIPIDVAREMGADIFIVVDVSAPLAGMEDLQSSIDITAQLTTILTRRVADQQLQSLTDTDVMVVPGREDLGSSSFLQYAELIQAGLDAAEDSLEKLEALSVTGAEYQAYRKSLPDVARRHPVIDYIQVKNRTRLDDEILELIISQKIGEQLDVLQLERDLQIIY